MSELEVLQKSFMESMDSMTKQFKKEKETLEKKLNECKEKYNKLKKDKENDSEMFKQNLQSSSDELVRLQNINRDLRKQIENNKLNEEKIKKYEKEIEELKKYKIKFNELNTQIPELKNKIENLTKEKNENNEINKKIKINEEKIKQYEQELNSMNEIKSQNNILNTKIKELENQLNSEIEQKNSIITEKNNLENNLHQKQEEIKELNEKLKSSETNNKQLLEKIKKAKEEEEIKLKEIEKNSENNIEKKNKFLIDILCEFLIKLNNSPHFLSTFDLLNKSLKNFDELNYFAKMSLKYNLPINNITFLFFSNLRSYILLRKENSSLKNFLSQKSFKYSEINKDDIETIKMIRTIKLNDNTNLLDLYVKKKELFFQKVELTFDLLKNKIISDYEEDIKESNKNILTDVPELLNILDPPNNLEINFDKINTNKLSLFVAFQINNIFSKLESLSFEVSKINLDIFYSIIFNCQNLKAINIKLNNRNLENNIVILNNIIPILFNNNKNLIELSYNNIPLMNKYLPIIVTSIKNSKLEKLSLKGSFTSKMDLAIFNSYFSSDNYLTEINFSNNKFNIPTLLCDSLLNYNISKKLTSINFSYCDLSDEDINIITKYIEENPSLKQCDISENDLSQKACFRLGTMIEKNNTLEKINLMNCKLNGENVLYIFSWKGSPGLKHFILNFNNIGDMGLIGIANFIKNSPNLEILELVNIGGNDMGFSSLVNILKSCNKIRIVHFERNKLNKNSIDLVKKSDEEFKNKNTKFFLDKLDGDKYKNDNIESIVFV